MGLGPIELNGMISRSQDYTSIRHNEDHKGLVDQSNFQNHLEKVVDHKLNRVNHGDDIENNGKPFDAKEKGSNDYSGDGGKNRKQKEKQPDKVILKNTNHFDIKI